MNLLCWAAAAAICLSVIYGPYDISKAGHIASKAESAMYNGFSRTAWSVGIGYVILACCLDCGGLLKSYAAACLSEDCAMSYPVVCCCRLGQ